MDAASLSINGIKYVSLFGPIGYFVAAKRYLMGLKKLGVPVTWTPMVCGKSWGLPLEPFQGTAVGDSELDSLCNKRVSYDTAIIHTAPDLYPKWVDIERNKRIFGYTVWETDRIPRNWTTLLNTVNHVLVPCEWNKEVFRRYGVEVPISVVPHIPGNRDLKGSANLQGIGPTDYVFYTIGTWTPRKALEKTVRSYLDAFTSDDPTILVIKTTEWGYAESVLDRLSEKGIRLSTKLKLPLWRDNSAPPRPQTERYLNRILRKYPSPARVKLLTEETDENEILKLHQRGDCYISLCRSEGWGLGAFDAAAFGRPIIMTGFGGHLDYLRADLAYLVDYRLIRVRDRSHRNQFYPNQRWAEPSVQHGSTLMRHVYENRKEARERSQMLKEHICENFSEEKTIRRLIQVLNQVSPARAF